MPREQLTQWVLCFYIYCFLGWVWETCYVSIRKKKFVNRGFMKGPLLPIYGSGALCILFASEPFRGNYVLMVLAGMVMATVLEYATGAAMEAIFRVRYWDYSNDFLNINGYVCLKSMFCWGAMTLLVVYGIHPPIMAFVESLRENVLHTLDAVITMLAVADFTTSFKDAWDFRTLLLRAEKLREEMRNIQLRLEDLENRMKERTREVILEETTRTKELLQEKTEQTLEVLQERTERTKRTVEALQERTERTREVLLEKAELAKETLQETAELARETLQETAEQAWGSWQENTVQRMEALQAELQELSSRKAAFQEGLRSGYYRGVHGILKRNPSASWKRHPEILEDMKKLFYEYRNDKREK